MSGGILDQPVGQTVKKERKITQPLIMKKYLIDVKNI
jgi:hypothetical protein